MYIVRSVATMNIYRREEVSLQVDGWELNGWRHSMSSTNKAGKSFVPKRINIILILHKIVQRGRDVQLPSVRAKVFNVTESISGVGWLLASMAPQSIFSA